MRTTRTLLRGRALGDNEARSATGRLLQIWYSTPVGLSRLNAADRKERTDTIQIIQLKDIIVGLKSIIRGTPQSPGIGFG